MIRTARTVVVASLALAVLTGCGGAAAEARGSHTFEPLPPLSTATPTQSPAPQPTSRPAPESSPAPAAEASAEQAAAGQTAAGQAAAGPAAVAGAAAPGGAPAGSGMPLVAPGQGAVPGQVPAIGAGAPVPGAGAVGGGTPVRATERTSISTTTTTSTSLEAGLKIVVTCEGLCLLGDLSSPELSGQDGPLSPDLLRQALDKELGGQTGGRQQLSDQLIEQLMQEQWDLAARDLEGGDEKLVFSSARR